MISKLTSAFIALTALAGTVSASPMFGLRESSSNITRRDVPAAPHFVIYSDKWVTGAVPDVAKVKGYTTFALSFLTTAGARDQAQNWASLPEDQRTKIKSSYNDAGIKLVVSAFGQTDTPTTANADPVKTADTMAAWVKQYKLDGIDVDYEDLDAFNGGKAEQWLIDFTTELRKQLPVNDFVLTHAPLAPWFTSAAGKYSGGGYLKINKQVGNMIDWYNIQFYNQGTSEYVTCDGLLNKSSATWPGTSVFEIIKSGVPSDKVVIGKPAIASDATNGFVDTKTLAACVKQATGNNWNAGVMVWEYPDADAAWIFTVKGSSF